jgi:hypothetical protein
MSSFEIGSKGFSSDLSPAELSCYNEDGILILAAPSSIQDLQQQFLGECCLFLKKWKKMQVFPADLPSVLATLSQTDRETVGKLYKVSRRFPSVKQLAANPFFVSLAARIMNTSLVSCCNYVNVRMDFPGEKKYLVPLHQDFPYIQGSLNGVTFWLPFHSLESEHGIPSVIKRSHKQGVHKVIEYTLDEIKGSGAKSFELANQNEYDESQFTTLSNLQSNQFLALDTCLLHRSNVNRHTEARLSVQLRFDDMFNNESFGRNYPEGLYLGDRLKDTYPEFIE